MPISHRNGDSRSCGASTIVSGQNFVTIDGQLWSVVGDPDSHGGGELINTQNFVTINGIYVILVGDPASPDSLCIPDGGPHCDPVAASGDATVTVG
jgi:uncharacterized Zn-binding protein involved in type VI secretion